MSDDDAGRDDLDAVGEWQDAVDRVCNLVGRMDEVRMAGIVPACPDWTARELLSHMVGLGASVLAGDEPDDHGRDWTRRHVEERRDRGAAELVEEWQGFRDQLADHMRATRPRPLADVIIHEHDLRGALEEPGARQSAGMRIVRGWMLERLAEELAALPPLVLASEEWEWSSSQSAQDGDTDEVTVIRAPSFDLDRAIVSRRSALELRRWVEVGDVEQYLDALAHLGELPSGPLRGG